MEYLYFYRFKPHNGKYRNLFKKRFQVIIRGSMNSALVEFEGGQREVISGNAIRKIRNPTLVLSEAEVSDIPNQDRGKTTMLEFNKHGYEINIWQDEDGWRSFIEWALEDGRFENEIHGPYSSQQEAEEAANQIVDRKINQ